MARRAAGARSAVAARWRSRARRRAARRAARVRSRRATRGRDRTRVLKLSGPWDRTADEIACLRLWAWRAGTDAARGRRASRARSCSSGSPPARARPRPTRGGGRSRSSRRSGAGRARARAARRAPLQPTARPGGARRPRLGTAPRLGANGWRSACRRTRRRRDRPRRLRRAQPARPAIAHVRPRARLHPRVVPALDRPRGPRRGRRAEPALSRVHARSAAADATYRWTTPCSSRSPAPTIVHDHHVEGLFPVHTWLYLLEQAGFAEARLDPGEPGDGDATQPVFIGMRPG